MLTPLLEIISLKVVNDRKIIDVSTACGDVTMLIAFVFLSKFLDELFCKNERNKITLSEIASNEALLNKYLQAYEDGCLLVVRDVLSKSMSCC